VTWSLVCLSADEDLLFALDRHVTHSWGMWWLSLDRSFATRIEVMKGIELRELQDTQQVRMSCVGPKAIGFRPHVAQSL
jgi:hypothetical protein